jgi:hypothetical protein
MEPYKKMIGVSAIVVTLLIALFFVYFFIIKPSPAGQGSGETAAPAESGTTSAAVPSPAKQREKDKVESETGSPPLIDSTIELNASDEPVRKLARECSNHPEFLQWLNTGNIIRRGVAIVDNIANGVSPAPHLRFLEPTDQFKAIRSNEKILLDPAGYIRYQPLTMVLVSLDPDELVKVYRQLIPVITEAYKELGYPGLNFRDALEQAIDVLLKTPIAEGDILLEEKVTTYTFADPQLEGLNDAQKHLLRMGPENVKKIQAKLREIKKALKNE